jgi:hypothetical protein
MNLEELLDLAALFVGLNESAAICLADARALVAKGDEEHARARALRSLMHSVGIGHYAYQLASASTFVTVDRVTGAHTSAPTTYEAARYAAAVRNSAENTLRYTVLAA